MDGASISIPPPPPPEPFVPFIAAELEKGVVMGEDMLVAVVVVVVVLAVVLLELELELDVVDVEGGAGPADEDPLIRRPCAVASASICGPRWERRLCRSIMDVVHASRSTGVRLEAWMNGSVSCRNYVRSVCAG